MALLHRAREGARSAGRFLHRHGKTIGSVLATAATVAATAHRVHQAIQGRPDRTPLTHHGTAHVFSWKPGEALPPPRYPSPII